MRQLLALYAAHTVFVGALLLAGCQNNTASPSAKGTSQPANAAPAAGIGPQGIIRAGATHCKGLFFALRPALG